MSNIYVSGNGNDTTGDGSIEHPFRTYSRAANLAQEGDTVVIGPGLGSSGSDIVNDPNESRKIYVAQTGSNVNGNGSIEKPFLTITHALGRALDGYAIIVAPGVYTDERLEFKSHMLLTAAIPGTVVLKNYVIYSAGQFNVTDGIASIGDAINGYDVINRAIFNDYNKLNRPKNAIEGNTVPVCDDEGRNIELE